jgi:Na+/H+ antiporter NhaA
MEITHKTDFETAHHEIRTRASERLSEILAITVLGGIGLALSLLIASYGGVDLGAGFF